MHKFLSGSQALERTAVNTQQCRSNEFVATNRAVSRVPCNRKTFVIDNLPLNIISHTAWLLTRAEFLAYHRMEKANWSLSPIPSPPPPFPFKSVRECFLGHKNELVVAHAPPVHRNLSNCECISDNGACACCLVVEGPPVHASIQLSTFLPLGCPPPLTHACVRAETPLHSCGSSLRYKAAQHISTATSCHASYEHA